HWPAVRRTRLMRLISFAALMVAALLDNARVGEPDSHANVIIIVSSLGLWCIVWWITLSRAMGKTHGCLTIVAIGDIVLWTLITYFTGIDRSLLFLLLLFRVADLRSVSFRQVILFGHVVVACYALLLARAPIGDTPAAEIVKLGLLYLATAYLA